MKLKETDINYFFCPHSKYAYLWLCIYSFYKTLLEFPLLDALSRFHVNKSNADTAKYGRVGMQTESQVYPAFANFYIVKFCNVEQNIYAVVNTIRLCKLCKQPRGS